MRWRSPHVSTGHRYVCPFPTWQAAAVVRSSASSTERPPMLFRLRALVVPSLLFAAACSGDSPSPTPDDPGPPGASGEGQTVTPIDQKATGLGMSIVSSDAAGAPRLIRAIVPRAVPAGMSPGAAALEHVAALKELWVQGQTTDLVERSTQPLRNGATVV